MFVISLQRKRWGAIVVTCLLVCLFVQAAPAQGTNNPAEGDSLPKVPASVIRDVGPYTRMSAYGLAGWHPSKRELWAKAIAPSYSAISAVAKTGESPQPHTLYPTQRNCIYH